MSKRGWALFAVMAVLWGIPYLLIRVAVRELDPGVLVLGRTAPAALALLPLVIVRGLGPTLRRALPWVIAFGVVEFGVPWFLMSTAERHVSSSLTSLVICSVPLFSVVAQRIRQTDAHISRRRMVGLLTGFLGVVALVGIDVHGSSLQWIGLLAIVCVGYSVGPMILEAKLSHVPGYVVVAGATAFVALAWVPWSVTHWPTRVHAETIACVAVLSLACTAAAFMTFAALIKEVGTTRSVVVTYANTTVAVILGIIGLHEPFTAGIALGFPLVVLGSYLATSRAETPAAVEVP